MQTERYLRLRRIRLLCGILLATVIAGLLLVTQAFYNVNRPINHHLNVRYVRMIHRIHYDDNRAFGYRTEISAINDQHTIYILHHSKIRNKAKALAQIKTMTRRINHVDNKMDSLKMDANNSQRKLKLLHSHSPIYNATKVYNIESGIRSKYKDEQILSICYIIIMVLAIASLWLIVKLVIVQNTMLKLKRKN